MHDVVSNRIMPICACQCPVFVRARGRCTEVSGFQMVRCWGHVLKTGSAEEPPFGADGPKGWGHIFDLHPPIPHVLACKISLRPYIKYVTPASLPWSPHTNDGFSAEPRVHFCSPGSGTPRGVSAIAGAIRLFSGKDEFSRRDPSRSTAACMSRICPETSAQRRARGRNRQAAEGT